MNHARTSSSSHGRRGGIAAPRRTLGSLLGLLVALGLLLALAVAQADNASTLTVVGTSDVVDSGLIANVIQPGFERAFPQYTMNYVSKGTGAAITYAEAGTASALVVHAASLENQFVAGGYSDERFGRAIFYGDYVLLGPPSDPAGVMTNAPHDIVTAFQDIAAAAANGKADFVSRGGTPGTTVEEHDIWALTSGPGSLTLCTVGAANGGGSSPSTSGGACPSTISYPSWYHVTGLTQGPNVIAADTCNFTNASHSGGNDCYVLTDRGTFQYLVHQAALHAMKIVTRSNSTTAKGGQDLLINSFHAYAIRPAKFAGNANVQINLPAAQAFLNYVTSPGVQSALKNYLGAGGDPPFIADASPTLTATGLPKLAAAGRKVTITGTVTNAVPGTPPLAGETVTVSRVGSGLPIGVPVASGRTDSTGKYRIAFTPLASGSYQVSTGQITQIENSTLNPVFGDLLQPAAGTAMRLTVRSAVSRLTVNPTPGRCRGRRIGASELRARQGQGHDPRTPARVADRVQDRGERRSGRSPGIVRDRDEAGNGPVATQGELPGRRCDRREHQRDREHHRGHGPDVVQGQDAQGEQRLSHADRLDQPGRCKPGAARRPGPDHVGGRTERLARDARRRGRVLADRHRVGCQGRIDVHRACETPPWIPMGPAARIRIGRAEREFLAAQSARRSLADVSGERPGRALFRPRRPRRRPRWLLCAVVIAAASAWLGPTASALQTSGGGVVVVDAASPGAPPRFVPNSGLFQPGRVTNVNGDAYPVGPTAAALLEGLSPPVDPAQVTAAEIVGTFPSTSYFPTTAGAQISPQGNLFGAQGPFFSANGAQSTATDSLIVPAGSVPIQSSGGTPLRFYLTTAQTVLALTLTLAPDSTTVPPGGTVTFTASTGSPGATGLVYSWDFGDGSPTFSGPSGTRSHQFPTSGGPFPVVVTVSGGPGGAAGFSSPVIITLGRRSTQSGLPASSGHNAGAPSAGNSGASAQTPSSPTQGSTSPGATSHGSAGGHAHNGTASGSTGTSANSNAQTSTASSTAPATTTSSKPPAAGAHGIPAQRHLAHQPPAAGSARGSVVVGQLVSDVTPISAAAAARELSSSGAPTAPPSPRPGGSSPLTAIAAGAIVIILLGCGARRELRWRRHPSTPVALG